MNKPAETHTLPAASAELLRSIMSSFGEAGPAPAAPRVTLRPARRAAHARAHQPGRY